ncbi:MAG: hypothetical protein ACM3XO_06290 [Bacteroidota bacterium]
MIYTLAITILVETVVVTGYSTWQNKPLGPLLLTSLVGNLLTQSLLWIALTVFFDSYAVTLLIGEIFVCVIETVLLYVIPANKLRLREAALLSLMMNLASMACGWFLPV